MKLQRVACVVASFLCVASFSSVAEASDFTVDAITPISSWLDTGLNLNAGTTYNFTVINPATTWSASAGAGPNYVSTADGLTDFSPFTNPDNGYAFNYGSLVGEAGSTFFFIGIGPTILSGLSGELLVGFWDDPSTSPYNFYADNSGSQELSVTTATPATPLPAALPLFSGGLGVMGFLGWRRRQKARVADV